MNREREYFTQEHASKLASQLAERAQIDTAAAKRVLEVLHIGKMNENLVALHEVMGNKAAVNALGISQQAAQDTLEALDEDSFTIENLRVGLKQPDLSGIVV